MTYKIFLSYRRDDEPQITKSLVLRLKKEFQNDPVFFDEESIRAGTPWPLEIASAVRTCPVMLVVMGRNWIGLDDKRQGKRLFSEDDWVRKEILTALECQSVIIPVLVNGQKSVPPKADLPKVLDFLADCQHRQIDINDDLTRKELYDEISRGLQKYREPPDGLPRNPHLFGYEKDIIEEFCRFSKITGWLPPSDHEQRLTQQGCPEEWPDVTRFPGRTWTNTLADTLGSPRKHDRFVGAKALFDEAHSSLHDKIRFREAGPREELVYPCGNQRQSLRVAILVSGGIAPGVNAVLDGIVRRHWDYSRSNAGGKAEYKVEIEGLLNGFQGIIHAINRGPHERVPRIPLFANSEHQRQRPDELGGIVTTLHVNEGGSIIGTARVDHLISESARIPTLHEIARRLRSRYDIVYIIGGDGTMRAAHALYTIARRQQQTEDYPHDGPSLSIVAVPKTMDNDILWVWQSFGFMSAVDRAREFIDNLSTEARSNPRVGIIQLFGSDSGFVVSHAVLASSSDICYLALIPEVPFEMKKIVPYLRKRILEGADRQSIPSALVVLSETAIPVDALDYLDEDAVSLSEPERKKIQFIGMTKSETEAVRSYCALRDRGGRLQGQTKDELRRGGLKIVSKLIEWEFLNTEAAGIDQSIDWKMTRIFTNEPRHLLRSIPPSPTDVITGHRLGSLAVDNALAGYTDFMISQWLTEFVLVPLQLVVLGRKRIPDKGIFWKSVCARTGQDV